MTVHKDMYIYGDSLIVLHSFFKCTVHFADSRRSELTVLNYILWVKAILEAARGHMAAMVEQDAAQASDVITFTSGGTEVRLMLPFFFLKINNALKPSQNKKDRNIF